MSNRIIITGVPKSGKTTLSQSDQYKGFSIKHTDDLNEKYEWSKESEVVASWFDNPGPWIVEGVTCPRALRKWLQGHPRGAPCDSVIFLPSPRIELNKGQLAMGKGLVTVWAEILPLLKSRGVKIS